MDILSRLRELAARICGKACKCKTCALKKPPAKEFATAEYHGRKVTLNSPRRIEGVTPAKKKRTVFVKNPKTGNVLAVHFGDSSMSDYTKHRSEKRRANFHSRHNCAEKKDKTKAGYWACKNLW